jgi:3-isopropylmalate/(R)-2-methylmalate dehydratase small subunit
MTAIRPDFPKEVRPGDVIVAGTNWGCGSHRDEAARVFMELGIKAIVADSMARIYYRMCLAYGLPALTCMGVSELFNEGEQIELDVSKGEIKNVTTGKRVMDKPMPESLLTLLEKGGMLPIILEKNK